MAIYIGAAVNKHKRTVIAGHYRAYCGLFYAAYPFDDKRPAYHERARASGGYERVALSGFEQAQSHRHRGHIILMPHGERIVAGF